MSLPTEPGVYLDAYGMPWLLSEYFALKTTEEGNVAEDIGLGWRFGDAPYDLADVKQYGPFKRMKVVEDD